MNTIELTAEELAIIEAKRAREEEARMEEERREAERQERRRIERERHLANVQKLVDAIAAIDVDGLISIDGTKLSFKVGKDEHGIRIEEHRVSSARSWYSSSSSGYKYLISGPFNDYKNQYYKSAKTVLKRIVEWQEAAIARAATAKRKASLAERALEFVKKTYPNAKVEFSEGYDYRGRSHTTRSQYKPDTINASTDRGSFEFSFYEKDGQIELGVWKRAIKSEKILAQVQEMILA